MIRPSHYLLAAVALACIAVGPPPTPAFAQVPAAPAAAPAGGSYSAADLEKLVGPFALYPDDLVALVVPASTFPLQIVQADRFLEKRKANPKLELDASWDDSVKSLLNYPDIIKKMSGDLDWTEALGEAVVANTGAVMDAVQAFRRRAQSAGNLKTDKQQTVVVEQEVIKIEPTDPQVVYVPQYQPSEVVVYGAPYYPYSPPYPAYWYPYAPGAALAAGVIWGAAIGAIWSGGRYASHYGGNNNITINRGNNNINTGDIGSGNRGGGNRNNAGNSNWKSSKQPGQVAGGGGNRQGNRAGDGRGGTGTMGAGAGGRGGAGGAGGQPLASTRGGGGGGDAFGGIKSGSSANRASARGNESRASGGGAGGAAHASPSGGGARASSGFSGSSGGARGGGGGGGGRGGGGGGRGGGGRR